MDSSVTVLSALGRRSTSDPTLLADCAQATVDAMTAVGAQRLIVVSMALLFPDLGMLASLLRRFVFATVLHDSEQMESVIATSRLDWTIARPPRLTNGGRAPYRVRRDGLREGGRSISRASLAEFLVDEAERREHTGAVVGVSR